MSPRKRGSKRGSKRGNRRKRKKSGYNVGRYTSTSSSRFINKIIKEMRQGKKASDQFMKYIASPVDGYAEIRKWGAFGKKNIGRFNINDVTKKMTRVGKLEYDSLPIREKRHLDNLLKELVENEGKRDNTVITNYTRRNKLKKAHYRRLLNVVGYYGQGRRMPYLYVVPNLDDRRMLVKNFGSYISGMRNPFKSNLMKDLLWKASDREKIVAKFANERFSGQYLKMAELNQFNFEELQLFNQEMRKHYRKKIKGKNKEKLIRSRIRKWQTNYSNFFVNGVPAIKDAGKVADIIDKNMDKEAMDKQIFPIIKPDGDFFMERFIKARLSGTYSAGKNIKKFKIMRVPVYSGKATADYLKTRKRENYNLKKADLLKKGFPVNVAKKQATAYAQAEIDKLGNVQYYGYTTGIMNNPVMMTLNLSKGSQNLFPELDEEEQQALIRRAVADSVESQGGIFYEAVTDPVERKHMHVAFDPGMYTSVKDFSKAIRNEMNDRIEWITGKNEPDYKFVKTVNVSGGMNKDTLMSYLASHGKTGKKLRIEEAQKVVADTGGRWEPGARGRKWRQHEAQGGICWWCRKPMVSSGKNNRIRHQSHHINPVSLGGPKDGAIRVVHQWCMPKADALAFWLNDQDMDPKKALDMSVKARQSTYDLIKKSRKK